MCDTILTGYWLKACENCKIPKNVADQWLKSIQQKYNSESHRIYHNRNILEMKFGFLSSLGSTITISDYLIFAIVFQYFHFDLKSESNVANCEAFEHFYNESGVNDVSYLSFYRI